MQKIVVFDIETTGFSAQEDFITQFAAQIHAADGQLMEKVNFYLKHPTKKLTNPRVIATTGINQDLLDRQGLAYNQALKQISEILLAADLLVGHNILKFDLPFIMKQIEISHLPDWKTINTTLLAKGQNQAFDTMIEARKADQVGPYARGYKLEDLVQKHNLQIEGATFHRADADIAYTWKLYEKLTTK